MIYSFESIEETPARKTMPITLVALATTPKVEAKPSKAMEKKEVSKPKPQKPKPKSKKPIVKEFKKPKPQKVKKLLKPTTQVVETTPLVQSEPLVKQESVETSNELETPLREPVAVAQQSEPQTSSAEKINIKNEYLKAIYQEIARLKVYPRNARKLGQSGVVKVSFKILADGTITDVSLKEKSGFRMLDKAAKKILINLAKVATIPKELNQQSINIDIPIEYKLEY